MADSRLHDLAAAVRASRPPLGMTTRVVAVDGLGGAGKSSLARALARRLRAAIVHTDDFASWELPLEWWPNLLEQVLEPLSENRPARFRPTSWGGAEREEIVVRPADVVLLEGVSASREAFRPYLAYSVWVETPREVRLRRGLVRDGHGARADWERWMAEEDAWVERERPLDRADLVLPGDAGLWS